ncbi:PREDICTED: pentatricopeptide [Prunus dulcis]|uniref:PREDICTED: pentatricopeptide n=1 Tax=Prunus dulcis TaxID=3755 RepID=A0A5E4EYK9_PRUDU|nr:PREDICTED: pentatricopeptide [Prunus dulcis]
MSSRANHPCLCFEGERDVMWPIALLICIPNLETSMLRNARLSETKSENGSSYTLLSSLYANGRRALENKRLGCSWVQGKKGNAAFFVGDRTHPESQEIYETLADLFKRIKDISHFTMCTYILITNNLRVCGDCHSAITYIHPRLLSTKSY